jgi:hypothetical protein
VKEGSQPRFPEALEAVSRTERLMGPWCSDPTFRIAERLKEIKQTVRQKELKAAVDDVYAKVGSEAPKGLHARILKLLNEPDLTDEQRKGVMVAKRDNLVRWEQQAYEAIYEVAKPDTLSTLCDRVLDYTDRNCPFSERQAAERKVAVDELKAWLEQFDSVRDYTLDAFQIRGFPAAPWYKTNWHPAFRLKVIPTNAASTVTSQ